jgi:N utilization substance protein A
LGTEKVDVIPWSESLETLVKHALKPAQVSSVEVRDSVAYVWLDDDQRSLAIGKMGQNIALASRLVELDIQLVQREGGSIQAEETFADDMHSDANEEQ